MNMLALALATAATTLIVPTITPLSNLDRLPATTVSNTRPADVIIGDGDFNQVRTEHPTDPVTEHANHTFRLRYIESMLRSRDVSDMPVELRAERARNLDRLHAYWTRGEYPVNYEHPTAWEPCFIDTKGAICAVGYLVEQSAGREFAQGIDSRYHFATIKQMNAPELDRWIATSGLTRAEVVTIQGPALEPGEGLVIQERARVARTRPVNDRTARVARAQRDDRKQVAIEESTEIRTNEPVDAVEVKEPPQELINTIAVAPAETPVQTMPVMQTAPVQVAAPAVEVAPATQTETTPSTGASID
jgi:hypothetical protein